MAANSSGRSRKRRGAGEGGIDELPSGKWRARFRGPDGRRHSKLFDRSVDASLWLAQEKVRAAQGGWMDPRAGSVSLETYTTRWLETRTDLRPTTVAKYRDLLKNHINPVLGESPVGRLLPSAVRDWYMTLRAHHAVTADDAFRLLRAVLNTAVTDDLILKNPCQVKGAGQVRSPERLIATLAEIAEAVKAIPERFRLALLLCVWCHLRRGEVLALKRRDFDLLHETVRIERALTVPMGGPPTIGPPKTEAGVRTLHVPRNVTPFLIDHLDRFVGSDPDAWLFATSSGFVVSPRNLQRAWDRARRVAGRPDLHLHDLRHTGLTFASIAGAGTAELRRRAGHRSSRAALMYQHATEDRDRVIADALADFADQAEVISLEQNDPPAALG